VTSFEEVSQHLLVGINKYHIKSVLWAVFEAGTSKYKALRQGHSNIKQGTKP